MLVLSLAARLFSMALADIHYLFGPVNDSYGPIYGQSRILHEFLHGFALSLIPMSALALFGLFISTIIRSPGAAGAVGISTLFIIDFTENLVGFDARIFTEDIDCSWIMLQQLGRTLNTNGRPNSEK